MNFWRHIHHELSAGKKVCLMYVVHSDGSSPGRQGFRQCVSHDATRIGSIGGGPMEQKLVELALHCLREGNTKSFQRRQVHKTNIDKNRSGMICSGEQTIIFNFLDFSTLPVVAEIILSLENNSDLILTLTESGLGAKGGKMEQPFHYEHREENQWIFREQLNFQFTVYIVGGGHVSLALSRTLFQLGFRIEVFDDRENLDTLEKNHFAHRREIIKYEEVDAFIPESDLAYVVLMTTGYRTDGIALRKLLGKNFRYLGLLGSAEKIRKLFDDLLSEGFAQEHLDRVRAPIGIAIHSHTPEEIAVSIAAEIIMVKNK